MTSSEDPERRIADLERPLARSEVGTEFSPESTRTGLRVGWIILALLVAGLIAGGGAILMGRAGSPVAGHPTAPDTLDGRSQRPTPPTSSSVPDVAPSSVPPDAPLPGPGPTPGVPVSVAGVGNQRTIDCVDNPVSISGVNNTVTLTGHCTRVDVSGIENTVTVDSADEIAVSGMNNGVTYRSGTPMLENSGMGNTIAPG